VGGNPPHTPPLGNGVQARLKQTLNQKDNQAPQPTKEENINLGQSTNNKIWTEEKEKLSKLGHAFLMKE
jgi:hypothetical protein